MSIETTITASDLLAASKKAAAFQKKGGSLIGTRIRADGHDFVLSTEEDVKAFLTFAFVPVHVDHKDAMLEKAQKWLKERPLEE